MNDSIVVIRVRAVDGGYQSEVSINDAAEAGARFEFDRAPGTQADAKIRNIEDGYCAPEDLTYTGAVLWGALLPGPLSAKVRETVEHNELTVVKLDVPEDLQSLPWESLYDSTLRAISCHQKISLIHCRSLGVATAAPNKTDRLGILVVIPEGSGLDVNKEWENLRISVAKLGNAVEVVPLRGQVTPDVFSKRLRSRTWNVVHFIGHGRLNDSYVEIRLNNDAGEEMWRNAEQFAMLFQGARVDACVLNCCYGGAANVATMDRLAPALMDAGVRGVVAMRYPLNDKEANNFSLSFYDHLLQGRNPGRLGFATQQGRQTLFLHATRDNIRSYITPLVHVAGASDLLFDIPAAAPESKTASVSYKTDASIVPSDLLEALRQSRCVPVIGTDLVAPPVERRTTAAPSLRGLVERLNELALALGTPPEPLTEHQLAHWSLDAQVSRLAERFDAANKGDKLVEAVRKYYAPQPPSELHQLVAKWPTERIFYTHFDGLMEAAFGANRPRIVSKLAESPQGISRGRSQGPSESLLVLVRGTINDRSSLILTEHDHFALSEQIDRVHASILSLARESSGRCVLFLGTSPGDRVTRELARKLLEANISRATEAFFVSVGHPANDELFWRRFKISFIHVGTDAFVRALTAAWTAT